MPLKYAFLVIATLVLQIFGALFTVVLAITVGLTGSNCDNSKCLNEEIYIFILTIGVPLLSSFLVGYFSKNWLKAFKFFGTIFFLDAVLIVLYWLLSGDYFSIGPITFPEVKTFEIF